MFEVTQKSAKSTRKGFTLSVNGNKYELDIAAKEKKLIKMVAVAFAENDQPFDTYAFKDHQQLSNVMDVASRGGYELNMVVVRL